MDDNKEEISRIPENGEELTWDELRYHILYQLRQLNEKIGEVRKKVDEVILPQMAMIQVEIAKLKTKSAIWGAIAGVIATAIVSIIVAIITKEIAH